MRLFGHSICLFIEKAKENYYKEALIDANAKETFRTLGKILNQNVRAVPSFDTPEALINKFADFFNDKVEKIRLDIDRDTVDSVNDADIGSVVQANSSDLETHLLEFKELDESEVYEIVANCANKSCDLDCIPTWLLKRNIDVVLPHITCIINKSLQSGVFPDVLKEATVTPILKKTSLDWNTLKNYRPVSNVNFLGKLIEKAAINQVNEHLESNALDEVKQSAYKCRHSTETALLRVKEDIVKALDCNKAVFLIMLDLSAAFDTIDHSILFNRLAADFGIKGTVLNWFKSHMTGRSFRVCVGGTKSETMSLKFGVPQGSIIGPKAFTMYSQPVADIIRRHGVQYHIYADDTQLYVAFNPKTPGDAACATFKLSSCVMEISRWMSCNKLKLNESKTEFFIAASKHNLVTLKNTTICIGSEEIHPSSTIKNLGVTFDSTMSMTPHIMATRKSINFTLWNMSRIRKFIDRDSCSHAMRALVLSRLDYANSLLAGCNTGDIKRLETLQNKAARIIFRVPRLESATPLLNTLHWLPVKKRIIFKTLLYVYKVLYGLAPAYLTQFISLYTVPREGLRSAKDTLRLNVPKTQLKISDGSFSSFGPKNWNKLPVPIRTSQTVATYKTQLKTHLFVHK